MNTQPIRILMVGGGRDSQKLLQQTIFGKDQTGEIIHTTSPDDALEALVVEKFTVCLIRATEIEPELAETVCRDAREAGIRTPIVVAMDMASEDLEQRFIDAGAMAAIPWDGSETMLLRNVVRLAVSLSKTEETLRKSNNQLVQDMVTMQDERERAISLSQEHIAMAEELELTRQELQSLNDQKSKFFSIIAHDLRSPFNALLGYTTLINQMGDKLTREQITGYSTQIHETAMRVFKLLENLLEWGRLQMDGVQTNPEQFPVLRIATRTIDALTPVAADKNISLIQDTGNIEAYADTHQADTIVRNLVNNAIKFTAHGGTVTISAQSKDGRTVIRVTDTGQGMSEEVAANLFNLTESVSTDGTNGEKGTGLGLLLCKDLAERNNATIEVESVLGKGSTFSLTLDAHAPTIQSKNSELKAGQ
ncbi:MAG: HAMP domain-containing histidine kinase [Rhodospirillaceae bacterium]|nr:HAMP domain-containing histidine kinase [Rhodospirillaceae bacterium]